MCLSEDCRQRPANRRSLRERGESRGRTRGDIVLVGIPVVTGLQDGRDDVLRAQAPRRPLFGTQKHGFGRFVACEDLRHNGFHRMQILLPLRYEVLDARCRRDPEVGPVQIDQHDFALSAAVDHDAVQLSFGQYLDGQQVRREGWFR